MQKLVRLFLYYVYYTRYQVWHFSCKKSKFQRNTATKTNISGKKNDRKMHQRTLKSQVYLQGKRKSKALLQENGVVFIYSQKVKIIFSSVFQADLLPQRPFTFKIKNRSKTIQGYYELIQNNLEDIVLQQLDATSIQIMLKSLHNAQTSR